MCWIKLLRHPIRAISIPGYTTNGFGDVMQEISADRGTIDSTYDSARNLKTVIDARGGKRTAVSLICELLSICNDAEQWMFCTSEADQVESLVGGRVGNYELRHSLELLMLIYRGCANQVWSTSFDTGGVSYSIISDRR